MERQASEDRAPMQFNGRSAVTHVNCSPRIPVRFNADDTVAEPNDAQKNNSTATGPLSRRVATRVQTAAIVAVTVVALGVGLAVGISVAEGT